MKWGLPGDISGGLMIFGIMFTIAIIELYILKARQALTVGSLTGGRGGAGNQQVSTPMQASGSGGGMSHCTKRGGAYVCPELISKQ